MTAKHTILVTGAGGAAVTAIIDNLKDAGWRVVAVDADKYAVGRLSADASYQVPLGNDAGYIAAMVDICRREQVEIVIPLVDEELIPLCESPLAMRCLLPDKQFVRACLDKYMLFHLLQRHGINVPATCSGAEIEWDAPLPCVVKPRTGRGSRGLEFFDDIWGLRHYLRCAKAPDSLVVQRRIMGAEYTVSVICDKAGTIHGVVPKEIIVKKGITKLAVTRHNQAIDALCRVVQNELHANGPFNVQLMLDERGIPWIFEINPRFSTSTTLTTEAFVDEVVGLVHERLVGDYPWLRDFREGIVMARRYADTFLTEIEARKIWG